MEENKLSESTEKSIEAETLQDNPEQQKEEEGDLGSCDSIRDFDSPMPNINGQPNRNCTAYIGDRGPLCTDSCCNSKCTKQFNQGVGVCDVFGVSNNACVCHYVC